jgi:hypothetical protein
MTDEDAGRSRPRPRKRYGVEIIDAEEWEALQQATKHPQAVSDGTGEPGPAEAATPIGESRIPRPAVSRPTKQHVDAERRSTWTAGQQYVAAMCLLIMCMGLGLVVGSTTFGLVVAGLAAIAMFVGIAIKKS